MGTDHVNRLRVIRWRDERGRSQLVGKADRRGNIYTMDGAPSRPRRFHRGAMMVSEAHRKRLEGIEQMRERGEFNSTGALWDEADDG